MSVPPGPRTFKDLIAILKARAVNPIEMYNNLFKKFGSIIYYKYGNLKIALVGEAEAIEIFLQTSISDVKKSDNYQRFSYALGNGLLLSEGEEWKRQRKLVSASFRPKKVEQYYGFICEETKNLIQRWSEGSTVEFSEEMNELTLKIICRSLFGINNLENSQEIRHLLGSALDYLKSPRFFIIQVLVYPFFFLDRAKLAHKIEVKLPFKDTKEYLQTLKKIDEIVFSIIKERLAKKDNENENLLDDLILSIKEDNESDEVKIHRLRDQVITLFFAGHETTANALSWTWLQILKYPEVYQKIKNEIAEVVSGDVPTLDEIQKMSYTKAVFEESLRLYPPFWRVSRKNLKPIQLKDYTIPVGTSVILSIYHLQRDSRYWEKPLEFRPERFLNKEPIVKGSYIPFGAGPRVCVAAQFATIEAVSIITLCMKQCDFTNLNSNEEPAMEIGVTLRPKDGCKAKVRKNNV